jgi:hypothetical protein
MYIKITFDDFVRAFKDAGRGEQFSPAALRALFDYINDFEAALGKPVGLDVAAVCRDYTEYPSAIEAAKDYGLDAESESDAEFLLGDQTTVLRTGDGDGDGVVIINF